MLNKWMHGRHRAIDGAVVVAPTLSPPQKEMQTLNLTRLAEMTSGKPDVMAKVLQQFIAHHADDLNVLNDSLSTGDFQRAFSIAHAIKGSSGQIGASELHVCAAIIEAPLRAGTPAAASDMEQFAGAFASAIDRVRDWLRDHVPASKNTVAATPSKPGALLAKLRQLNLLLDATDGHALVIAEELAGELPPVLGERFARILDLIGRFELAAAAEAMKSILPELEAELS